MRRGFPDAAGLGIFACRKSLAGKEFSVPAPFYDKLVFAAERADSIGRFLVLRAEFLDVLLDGFKPVREGSVKFLQDRHPFRLAVLDPVQFQFHICRKSNVEHIGELLGEHVLNGKSHLGRQKAPVFKRHIFPAFERINDLRIGTRPADAFVLKLPHERCFAIARRRLGKMLLFRKLLQRQRSRRRNRRKRFI